MYSHIRAYVLGLFCLFCLHVCIYIFCFPLVNQICVYYNMLYKNSSIVAIVVIIIIISGIIIQQLSIGVYFCVTPSCSSVYVCISEFRSPSHLSGLNRSASLNYTDRTESQSISGSSTQLNSAPSPQYIPDFNVRALTDLQIVKVRIF